MTPSQTSRHCASLTQATPRRPYLLPCLCAASLGVVATLMCIFVLEESLIRGADPTAPKRAGGHNLWPEALLRGLRSARCHGPRSQTRLKCQMEFASSCA